MRGWIALIIHCTRISVPSDAAGVTSDADARVRAGLCGRRSKASGLSTRGRGAPLPLRVLKRPEAKSPPYSGRSIVEYASRSTR